MTDSSSSLLRVDGNEINMHDAKTYCKTAMVRAIRIDYHFYVVTKEGTMTGEAGDYLCEGIEGERWPVKRAIFEKTYEESKP